METPLRGKVALVTGGDANNASKFGLLGKSEAVKIAVEDYRAQRSACAAAARKDAGQPPEIRPTRPSRR